MNIGKSLRIALAAKDMKQKDLAEQTGIHHQTISNICNSETTSINNIQKIAEALDIKVSTLIAIGEE